MLKRLIGAGAAAFVAMAVSMTAEAQQPEFTFRIHQLLPAQAFIPADFIKPWADKVEQESNGRIKFEHYPSMQLGGTPPSLYDQAREGVVDIIWTVLGYTPGRFPKSEAFELPFFVTNAEDTSEAFWEYYEKHLQDEFQDVKVLAVHTHGPGLIHVKGDGVRKLEDMSGLKLRGPTRTVTSLLERLGATAIGMPVPAVPESLSKGVIDGAVIPWEVTVPLKIPELVDTHTRFSGENGLYAATFVFAMNQGSYDKLPDDLKKVIDDNSGAVASAWAGRVMDEGDVTGQELAEQTDNDIVTLDEAETERWKEASQPVVDAWIEEMNGKGFDGAQLVEDARALIEQHTD
jgi:TRAP-type C4-dicarboxylate transport system substrate-binding protein